MGWVDSHAHLMSRGLVEDFVAIKQNAIDANITKICVICGSLEEIENALALIENDPMFDLAVGVHPGSAKNITSLEFEAMMSYLKHPQVKFLGEIGLDYYWDQSYNDLQKALFIKQIEYANKENLPIIIHMRDSSDDVYHILKTYKVNKKGVAHCFTEDVTSARRFVDLGYYIGIGGIITFKNGENIRSLVRELPFDRILSETDSPYLTPVPYRGKRNESAYVSYVGKEIARIKKLPETEVQKVLMDNYNQLKAK